MDRADILIGVYEENGQLIGYKADSFWSLTKSQERAKPHSLEDGKIPANMISNLRSMLQPEGRSLIAVIQAATKERYFGRFETRLVGFEREGRRVFTHRVFDGDVQELDAEDLAQVEARTKAAA